MNMTLKASNTLELKNGFFLIKKGKVFVRSIFENGKIIGSNIIFQKGDIVGDFLKLVPIDIESFHLNIILEIIAIEDCEFEKIEIPNFPNNDEQTNLYEKIIFQLAKKHALDILYILLPKNLYIIAVLSLMSQQGIINKKNINPENFNMSKSQFYNLYSKIKKEKIFTEKKEQICLNLKEVANKLDNFFLEVS